MAANKVFIVEDDAVIARAVAAHLTTWQMQVQCAGNFEKITEEVEDFQPDIIIIQIQYDFSTFDRVACEFASIASSKYSL